MVQDSQDLKRDESATKYPLDSLRLGRKSWREWQKDVYTSMELEVIQRWGGYVHDIAPGLHQCGRMASFGMVGGLGVGVLGKRSTSTILDQIIAGSPNDPLLRHLVRPVLEPFLAGLNEPVREYSPLIVGAFVGYGLTCFGIGFGIASFLRRD
mmetsp:Transcript_39619/g.62930  ORF Transcript_39619/g.62930 Transcript_39619/m.62930 type:complete len:153 (+) Transcript_39619:35-493(+)